MTIRVEIREGENLKEAVNKLHQRVNMMFGRAWYKSRIGYYEKPSERRRRKRNLRKRNLKLIEQHGPPVRMRHGLKTIHQREKGFP